MEHDGLVKMTSMLCNGTNLNVCNHTILPQASSKTGLRGVEKQTNQPDLCFQRLGITEGLDMVDT